MTGTHEKEILKVSVDLARVETKIDNISESINEVKSSFQDHEKRLQSVEKDVGFVKKIWAVLTTLIALISAFSYNWVKKKLFGGGP